MRTLEEFNNVLERTEREFLWDSLYAKNLNQVYPRWLEEVSTFLNSSENPCPEFAQLCMAHIENKHCRLSFYDSTVLHSKSMQQLLNFFQQYPQQRNHALGILGQLGKSAYQIAQEIDPNGRHVNDYYQKHIATGFYKLEEELIYTKILWDSLTLLEQQQEYPLPAPLIALLHDLVHYYTPYSRTMDYEEITEQASKVIGEIAKQYPAEVYHLNLHFKFPTEELPRYIKFCFNQLLSKKHKYLNDPERFLYLLGNFKRLDESYDAKAFLLALITPFEVLAKQNQLTEEIVTLMSNISFAKYCHRGIPMKRLDQIDQKVQDIVENFHKSQQQIAQNLDSVESLSILDEPYQLPLSDTSVSTAWNNGKQALTWPKTLQQQFDALPENEKIQWMAFWQHIDSTTAKKPSQKWLNTAKMVFSSVIQQGYTEQLEKWLHLIKVNSPTDTRPFDARNENSIKGLLWFTLLQPTDDKVLKVFGDFAQFCYKKIYGIGATSGALGGMTLYVIAQHGMKGLAKLSYLQKKIRYDIAQKNIRTSLELAAESNHLTVDELKDVVAEDFEFVHGQHLESRSWKDYQVKLQCVKQHQCSLVLYDANNAVVDVVPKGFKTSRELKDLWQRASEISKNLNVYAKDFEHYFIQQRQWTYSFWKDYVISHGVLGWLASRLIWNLYSDENSFPIQAMFNGTDWYDATGAVITMPDIATLSLWHPIQSTAEQVLAWRKYLMDTEMSQCFHQAFREVYVVTPAEINTKHQSLRFAHHYLKQSKFKAVANDRGWGYDIQGGWDNFGSPYRIYQDIQVVLHIECPHHNELLSDSGVYLYIKTKEIHFYQQGQKMALDAVPAIVFSELMRDIDYFIQGCSIGMDLSLGEQSFPAEMQQYYRSGYRQSNSQMIEARQHTLDLILSKLSIAAQCRLEKEFVYVKGTLHEYKIHLGTGHIWMPPNDQYLCIVPEKRLQDISLQHIFLPFEDDEMLSLILSKILLLSKDDQIQDQLILKQIQVA